MQRVLMSAMALSAMMAGGAQAQGYGQPVYGQPVYGQVYGQPVYVQTPAAQPYPAYPQAQPVAANLGGGLIEYVFTGGGRQAAQQAPVRQVPVQHVPARRGSQRQAAMPQGEPMPPPPPGAEEPAPRYVAQPYAARPAYDPRQPAQAYVHAQPAPLYARQPAYAAPQPVYLQTQPQPAPIYQPAYRQPAPHYAAPAYGAAPQPRMAALPGPGQAVPDPRYQMQEVPYDGPERPGTIVIDTPRRFLYLVQEGGRAIRYGIGVGRPGFTWAGEHRITAMREWPDWRPPPEMLKRQPYLPRHMPGGPNNPLGARAMYLGSTLYRIHGSNEPWTIGQAVSSGCIRMRNEDVADLYARVKVGTKVVVM